MANPLNFLMGKNPAKAAMPYLDKIAPMAERQYNPYIEEGRRAGTAAQGTYGQMAQDPTGFLDKILGNYSMSKGFQHKYDLGTKALHNAAAAGGFGGTNRHQMEQGDLVNRIMSQGQGEYVDQIMKILGGGLQGQELGAERGFGATGSLADALGGALSSQGTLAYQGQAERNATKQNLINQAVRLAMAGMTGGLSELGNMGGGQSMPGASGATPAAMGVGMGAGSQGSRYINDYLSNQRHFGGRNF